VIERIASITAEAERADSFSYREEHTRGSRGRVPIEELPEHSFAANSGGFAEENHSLQSLDQLEGGSTSAGTVGPLSGESDRWWTTEDSEEQRARRIYRGQTVRLLRRYMRYSIETGRLPSILGREFFGSKVTAYTVVTFEDRVIFVHDMETCLGRLDEFSRQLIARRILQEHDQAETGKLLQCAERTVRTYLPVALNLLSDILLEAGMLDRVFSNRKNTCQGGLESKLSVSGCEDGKNKF